MGHSPSALGAVQTQHKTQVPATQSLQSETRVLNPWLAGQILSVELCYLVLKVPHEPRSLAAEE